MKKCPYCAEEIKNDAIKCRYCNSIIDEVNNKEKIKFEKIDKHQQNGSTNKKYNSLAIASFVLGLLSMFFASIGIIPTIALIVSIIGLLKIKYLRKKYKIFLLIGSLLSLVYFLVYLFMFSAITKDISLTDVNISNVFDEKSAPKITNMEYKKYVSYPREVLWWFDEDVDKYWANQEWGCYFDCSLEFYNKDTQKNLFAISLADNTCHTWVKIPTEKNQLLDTGKPFCVQMVCDSRMTDKIGCFKNDN